MYILYIKMYWGIFRPLLYSNSYLYHFRFLYYIYIFLRNLSRSIIIQFEPIEKIFKGKEKAGVFKRLHKAEKEASASIGQLISISQKIFSGNDFEEKFESLSTQVSDLLHDKLLRMTETYSIWLHATIKVSN